MKQSHHSSFGNAIDLLHDAGTDKHEKSVSLRTSYLAIEPISWLRRGGRDWIPDTNIPSI
jgi:hypothetical protein